MASRLVNIVVDARDGDGRGDVGDGANHIGNEQRVSIQRIIEDLCTYIYFYL